MPANAVAENVFGTMGAIFWTVQLIPQLFKTWRTKSTKGLSPWLVFLWGIAALPLGVYVIAQDLNVPLIVQPQLFGLFSLLSWGQCLYYRERRDAVAASRSRARCAVVLGCTLALWGALEAALVFAVRPSYRRGAPAGKAGVQFFGILGSALIAIALLPQYYEIHKHRAVLGISLTFMAIDLLGGVFSLLSLVFKRRLDVLAAVAYSLVVVMDGLVLVLAAILNPRAERSARRGESGPRDHAYDEPCDGGTAIATAVVLAAAVQNEEQPVTDVSSMDFAPS